MATPKIRRSINKGRLTKEARQLRRCIAEADYEELETRVASYKLIYREFLISHENYVESLPDEETSEPYFEEVFQSYSQILGEIRKCTTVPVVEPVSPQLSLVNLPKMGFESFEGDPRKYTDFIHTFETSVASVITDPQLRLTRLINHTSGKARDAIRSCGLLGGREGYELALKTLEERFGSPFIIAEVIIGDIRSHRLVTNCEDLRDLSDKLRVAETILTKLNMFNEVNSQTVIKDIVNKLKPYLRFKWHDEALDFKRVNSKYPSFSEFVLFMEKLSMEANDPVYGQRTPEPPRAKMSFTANTSRPKLKSFSSCGMCNGNHHLSSCDQFLNLTSTQRFSFIMQSGFCTNCLRDNHRSEHCFLMPQCRCNNKHHSLLHIEEPPPLIDLSPADRNARQVLSSHTGPSVSVALPVVPVLIDSKLIAYALLDTGSSSSFISRDLVSKLGLGSREVNVELSTLSGTSNLRNNRIVDFTLASLHNNNKLCMNNVLCIDSIPVSIPKLNISMYTHLSGLSFPENISVHILIGQDYPDALTPLDVRSGQNGDPFAVLTTLGWCLNGPIHRTSTSKVVSHLNLTEVQSNIEKLYDLENDILDYTLTTYSKSEREVISLWDNTCSIVNNYITLPIPWKNPDHNLPNNYVLAKSRLDSLIRSLKRKNTYNLYSDQIEIMIGKGFAERIDCSGPEGKTFYIPHHGVPKKSGAIRVVFDCASVYKGVSLNSLVKQGPNLTLNLIDVLIRFRQFRCAFSADIEDMFNCVKVPDHDRDMLRFLWYDNNQYVTYRMTTHLFGGVWSPSAATYALRRCCEDHQCSEGLREILSSSFYVDDLLVSSNNVPESIEIASSIKDLLKKYNFNLKKFVSNDPLTFENYDESLLIKTENNSNIVKVLGIGWKLSTDELFLTFEYKIKELLSKADMLSTLASIYDPIGLISPVIMRGKIIFQDTVRSKLNWSDQVPLDIKNKWNSWLHSISDVNNIHFTRSLFHATPLNAVIQLHCFSDASAKGYGAAVYLRCVQSNEVHVRLLYSKGRVAPIKVTTIPRLELQAALLSVKLEASIKRILSTPISQSFFWTDSRIVLGYIQNECSKFHIFVSNRVAAIQKMTSTEDWYHISGPNNPADIISRGCAVDQVVSRFWMEGPSFLKHVNLQVNREPVDTINYEDSEVRSKCRSNVITNCLVNHIEHPMMTLFNYYSDFLRLKRAVAWILAVRESLLKTSNKEILPLNVTRSETFIIKFIQLVHFRDELIVLSNNKQVKMSSPLYKLNPVINDEGLLVVGGRIHSQPVVAEFQYPVIIPYGSPVALLIVKDVHERAHVGREWTLANIRKRFWIIKGRSLVYQVIRNCIICKKLFGKAPTQLMANLPPERLSLNNPPFTHTGVDCLGPFFVKRGRSEVKRYGCLFTCLTMRAIHLEVLESLDTMSMINALRRFISRRGTPKTLTSDNGTNFRGADAELRRNIKDLKDHVFLENNNMKWVFLPPSAPHMGGVWERLVKTVKRVLQGLQRDMTRLNDEALQTLFCEVESIVNSRPLTKVSEDASDSFAITPNHLLIMKSSSPPVGTFDKLDMFRNRWKHVQHLADLFWERWLKEYLPELQKRGKWQKQYANVKMGDIVLLSDDSTPRLQWPLGVITECNVGTDGLVRSVTLRSKGKVVSRPITKLILLECVNNQ